ncbi:MAG TPA: glycine oxidase ThiO [Pyrinomonadaceae bacterium]|nr:glycine oxidase ThiO [Pyrinomonadaceae bacterium]
MSHDIQSADVVIIGGGVIGLAIARALVLRGVRDVSLVERSSLGAEASSAAAGMLAPQAEADSADEFFRLACQSRDRYPAFAAALLEETGVDIELDQTGTLYAAFNDHDWIELEKRYRWQTDAGLPVEKLTRADATLLEPSINSEVIGALRFPLDIQVENRRLVNALILANNALEVRVTTGTAVTSVKIERQRIVGVETSRGLINTNCVVNAAGAWSSLLEKTDIALPDPCIKPVRGQMLCFEATAPVTRHVVYSARGYIVPRRDGRLLAGTTSENVGFEKRVTAAGTQSILAAALEISPRLGALPLVDSWAGLRPCAADALPVIGPCAEIDGLYFATGHFRNGILLAPITAELIARSIVDKETPAPLLAFSPDRFRLVSVS